MGGTTNRLKASLEKSHLIENLVFEEWAKPGTRSWASVMVIFSLVGRLKGRDKDLLGVGSEICYNHCVFDDKIDIVTY